MKHTILSITALIITSSLATSAQAEVQCRGSNAVGLCRNETIQLSDRRRNDDHYRALNRIYREVLGREVDSDGLESWSRKLDKGKSLSDVREDIADSSEARNVVNRIHRELTGRDASRDTIKHYTEKLGRGWTLNDVRADLGGDRDRRRNSDRRRQNVQPPVAPPPSPVSPVNRPPIPPRLPGSRTNQ